MRDWHTKVTEARHRLAARMLDAQAQMDSTDAAAKKAAKGFAGQMLKGKLPSLVAVLGFQALVSDDCKKIERTLADIEREGDMLDAREREVEVVALTGLVNCTADAIASASILIGVEPNDETFVRAVLRTLGSSDERLVVAAYEELALRSNASSVNAKMIIARRYSEIKEAA